ASGTSMATPHLVGCAALVRSVNPALGPAQVEAVLKSTTRDLGSPGWDSYMGSGRIDCAAAVLQSGAQGPLPTATSTATLDVTVTSTTSTPGTPTAISTSMTATASSTPTITP